MQVLHNAKQAAQWLKQQVTGTLTSDSRTVARGDGFVAWPGAAVDARKFVHSAMENGATVCLAERDGIEAFGLPADTVGSYAGLKADTGVIVGSPGTELEFAL